MLRQSCKVGGACGLGAQDTGDSAEFSTDGCSNGVPRAGTRIACVGMRRAPPIRATVAPSAVHLQTLFVCGGCESKECLASATSINTADAGSAWIDLPNMCVSAVATDGSVPPQARPAAPCHAIRYLQRRDAVAFRVGSGILVLGGANGDQACPRVALGSAAWARLGWM